jgi:hypothetical protein
MQLTTKQVNGLVQKLFSYPEGPFVLQWLEDLYQRYPFRHIVQGESRNAPYAMAYKAGQHDVVTLIREVYEHGLADDQPTKGEGDGGPSELDWGNGGTGEAGRTAESTDTDDDE